MRKRILITGGSGLLALNWALAVRENFSVTLGLHRRSISLDVIEHLAIDLESVENLTQSLSLLNPDVVIHTVGLSSIELCEADPKLAQYVNAELAEMVAMACAVQGIPLVHISTDHLFAGNELLLAESDPIMPVNTYARTKGEGEDKVIKAYPDALVVRTNFFGWGTSYRQSFSDFIIEGLRTGKQLTLFDDVFITPILAETLALIVHELVDYKVSGVVNVVGDERLSKYEFGMKLADQFGLDRNLIKQGAISDHSGLVKRPKDMSLSNKKVCELLGRKLGSVNEQLARLLQQESLEIFQQVRSL